MSLNAFVEMLKSDAGYVVLDTETTGLHDGEIVQIAIASHTGEVLLNTLVRPYRGIPADAMRIHGITEKMCSDAPRWGEIAPKVVDILTGQNVVVYNAVYDRRMMHQSGEYAQLPKTDWKQISRWWCAMEAFAEQYGDWNSYRQNYRWQSLSTAANYYRLPISNAHTALGDVIMTLQLCRKMCGATG
jgi:DNA polymerase-3 subunit epsilon